jgi:hypothetical protein
MTCSFGSFSRLCTRSASSQKAELTFLDDEGVSRTLVPEGQSMVVPANLIDRSRGKRTIPVTTTSCHKQSDVERIKSPSTPSRLTADEASGLLMEANGSSAGPSKPRHDILASNPNGPLTPVPEVQPFHASIRFSSTSLNDLEITIPNINASPLPTVFILKQQIRFLRPVETHNRRLRLILAGKVLIDHIPLKAISHRARRPSIPPVTPSVKGKEKEVIVDRLWIHCSMGEQLPDEEFEEEERDNQTQSTLPQPVGFDRLRSAGFSNDDITSLRAQFRRFHGARGDDEGVTDVTAMEERWLDETIGLGGGASVGDGGTCS